MRSILIAGSGGQGVLFLGKLLAHGAMRSGWNVTWFPSYGAEMRGGTANCTVVVSDEVIGSPIVAHPDILVVMNEASRMRFEGRLRAGGLLLSDSSLVASSGSRPDICRIRVPATETAQSLGSAKAANMVLLGSLLAEEDLIDPETLRSALEELTPAHRRKDLAVNRRAVEEGRAFRGGSKG